MIKTKRGAKKANKASKHGMIQLLGWGFQPELLVPQMQAQVKGLHEHQACHCRRCPNMPCPFMKPPKEHTMQANAPLKDGTHPMPPQWIPSPANPVLSCSDALKKALHHLGYDSFRPGQREAVETLLSARRLLLVAPTGGGKSLCYQLPAHLLTGTTLVISPLIALMHDQVHALNSRGVPATFLASILEPAILRQRMAQLARGAFKLVYAAPERLAFDGFRGLLRALQCPLIAIDEAHCISEWGHDFRPEYLKIGDLLKEFPQARVLACTATATPVVRDEILNRLGLDPETPQIIRGFARANLALQVREAPHARERHDHTDALLKEALHQPGARQGTAIVYAPTRKSAQEEAQRLLQKGWKAQAYHAGLDGIQRDKVQHAFMAGALEMAVATCAFGMGIDRPDVRAVIHMAPPGSIEAYYQEVGRAGRDGDPAWALLFTTPSDMPLRRSLLERGAGDGSRPLPAVIEHKWNLFLELMRWAEGGSCRHDAILRYFGDESETLHGCGRCDVCVALDQPQSEADPHVVQVFVRKALSGIARVHGRFGLKAAVQLVRGVADPRLQRAGLTHLRTFGVLKAHSEAWVLALMRRCVTAGWIDFRGGDRPRVILTEAGVRVMKAQKPARLLLPPHPTPTPSMPTPSAVPGVSSTGSSMGSQRSVSPPLKPEEILDATALRIFEALRRHRLKLARASKLPPYVIASDRTLRDLAMLQPKNLEELKMAHGIGSAKADKYGPDWLQLIAQRDA